MRSSSRGFTLIELLVVVAIIGLLSSVVLASLSSARQAARNAQRRTDIHQLQTAVEFYFDRKGAYPPYGTTFVTDDLTVLVPNNIQVLPHDPQVQTAVGGTDYRYASSGGTTGYTLLAFIEKTNNWCQVSVGTDPFNWGGQFPHC